MGAGTRGLLGGRTGVVHLVARPSKTAKAAFLLGILCAVKLSESCCSSILPSVVRMWRWLPNMSYPYSSG